MLDLIKSDGSNLSIVIQGALSSLEETSKIIHSYELFLPKAEIIISTWNDYANFASRHDKVVISDDPGPIDFSRFGGRAQHNFNRQIVSSKNGLNNASRSFSLKVRSDLVLVNNNLVENYNNALKNSHKLNQEFFLNKPLLAISNESSKKPSLFPAYLHFCDWFILGTTNEVKKLFSCSVVNLEDMTYKNNELIPAVYKKLNLPEIKWSVETYIWTNYFKKYYRFEMINEFDNSKIIKEVHNQIISSNLIILDQKRAGITVLKKNVCK